MLIPEFDGGLGNMMFQFASTYALAKQTGHRFGVFDIPLPPPKHSLMDYKSTILKDWFFFKTNLLPSHKVIEHNGLPLDLDKIRAIPDEHGVILSGYFQKHYFLDPYKEEVKQLFDIPFSKELENRYPDINNAYFLHVRRGDYVGNKFHELDLTKYYERAIQRINSTTQGTGIAYIVSNDIEWCRKWDLLKNIPHRFVEENEVYTLAIMIRCGLGGVACNSSFSWWGLYLDTNRPHLILPSKWLPHDIVYTDGYYFKEATVIEVE
jgi:hypothetical protein